MAELLMVDAPWSLAIPEGEPTALGALGGQVELRSCCLVSGEQALLHCEGAGGLQVVLCRVTRDRPSCKVRGKLGGAVKMAATGGEVLVSGTKRSFSSAGIAPAAKRAKAAAASDAPGAREAKQEEPAPSGQKAAPAAAPPGRAPAAPPKRQAEAEAKVEVAAKAKAKAEPEAEAKAKAAAKATAGAKAKTKPEVDTKVPVARRQLKGGVAYEVLRVGHGQQASPGKSVQVRYEGRLAKNGQRFDKGVIKFRLGMGEVIQGWDEGVKGMLRGERRRLLIPARMGYGPRGAPPDIPANADLVFEVELLQC